MKCPQCGQLNSRVIDSRPSDEGISLRRRRSCDSCGHRFTTHERVQQTPLMVVKKDGRREEFSPEKLRSGIAKACDKRSVSTDEINNFVQALETQLRQEGGSEIAAERVGEMVMEKLYHLDQVAYVRFASVYQRFDDVRRFALLLERMSRRNRNRSRKQPSTIPEPRRLPNEESQHDGIEEPKEEPNITHSKRNTALGEGEPS